MRVFMLGWEFPPFISGGLGTACYGLTHGLDASGVDVCFVLPTAKPVDRGDSQHITREMIDQITKQTDSENNKLLQAIRSKAQSVEMPSGLTVHKLNAILEPYTAPVSDNFLDIEQIKLFARKTASGLTKGFENRSSETKKMLRQVINAIKHNNQIETESDSLDSSPRSEDDYQMKLPNGSVVLGGAGVHYDGDLMDQVKKYAKLAVELALEEEFDVIHAHDWMTYAAGLAVKEATGKPLVVHVHSTEFDRSGENVHKQVSQVEKAGITQADQVICVSHLTKSIAIHGYGANPQKTAVVYNAVDAPEISSDLELPIKSDEKIVLFLGRITMQKGPEYFLEAAKRVVEKFPKVRFIMAGNGDMIRRCVKQAADLKIGKHVTFTGFLRGDDVAKVFKLADLYVMPSVSEPFGIAPLEAISHDVPVLISKQSGVSEVLTHALKVDFWDIDEMANKIIATLKHDPLRNTLRQHGRFELQKLSWNDSGKQLKEIYQSLIGKQQSNDKITN